jgi:hypothetical protein
MCLSHTKNAVVTCRNFSPTIRSCRLALRSTVTRLAEGCSFVALVVLLVSACGGRAAPSATVNRQPSATTVATPAATLTATPASPLQPVLANAETFLSIPTYDGSGQVVHPDIAYFSRGWHGYRYWMAITPYPFGNDQHENVSVVTSNDGVDWIVPPGLVNPLIPVPACDHNSDPDLVYDASTDELYLFYTEQQRGERCGTLNENRLRLLKSSDGVHWSSPQTVITWDLAGAPLYLSPGVTFRRGSFEVWLAGGSGVMHATSNDGANWSPLEPVHIEALPWHLDVVYLEARSEYWMLFVDSPLAGSNLRLATSKDGIKWAVYPAPLVAPGSSWDDERIYRATFLLGADGLRVWYSAKNQMEEWHVGYTEAAVDSLALD